MMDPLREPGAQVEQTLPELLIGALMLQLRPEDADR
jgi:hypothetical protein